MRVYIIFARGKCIIKAGWTGVRYQDNYLQDPIPECGSKISYLPRSRGQGIDDRVKSLIRCFRLVSAAESGERVYRCGSVILVLGRESHTHAHSIFERNQGQPIIIAGGRLNIIENARQPRLNAVDCRAHTSCSVNDESNIHRPARRSLSRYGAGPERPDAFSGAGHHDQR
jgi:hypothetical protein